jgi:hypothetical protein
MFRAANRPLPISDQFSIAWWRLVLSAARAAKRLKIWGVPVFTPLIPYLWLPVLALAGGIVIGWAIAAG